jgi:hypothetical protein
MTIERNIYRIVLLIAIGYILFLQMCSKPGGCPDQVKSVKIDTGYIIEKFKSTWQKPKPDTIIRIGKNPKPKIIFQDGPATIIMKDVDTAAILQDYFSKVYYLDSLKTQYGFITVEDTISQNRIQARRWHTNFSIPTITKTITQSAKPRNQVYGGFSGLFGQQNIGAEINLTLKNKKDQQYEIGAGLFGSQPYGRIGTKFKLSFKK